MSPQPDRNHTSVSPALIPRKRTLSSSYSPSRKQSGVQLLSLAQSQQTSISDNCSDNGAIEYDDNGSVGSTNGQSQLIGDAELSRYPRFMLPRASGMSTMGEIQSLALSPRTQSPTISIPNVSGYDQPLAYPATWREYEDQFNYFYNCHFIEQDYYDYLAGRHHQHTGSSYSIGNNRDNTAATSANRIRDRDEDENNEASDATESYSEVSTSENSVNEAGYPEDDAYMSSNDGSGSFDQPTEEAYEPSLHLEEDKCGTSTQNSKARSM
ncbi:hypothetical protein GGI25_005702 [Coemansia spiralis]|uniref:Uncharacterized protein n=2 Tax=Coemansia TaxID=4863 RepID=A0A9W8FY68_9FUNG|nr:hypothetical protein BX070DRAFT_232324 [Coemansia spiralis]KAJ1988137.1 hypothetical protein EDC05_005460 [Coemansia umbellata]KAJ2625566.1 hypothetical protein GGI26_000365 [Coemansia sp. RSA 1358]KAJ2670824.1 hypothetical protein GGI25_005702 [Coemansia spiralis]